MNMKKKCNSKAMAAMVLAVSCIGMTLSGCAAGGNAAEGRQVSETSDETADLTGGGQSITEEDHPQTSASDQNTQDAVAADDGLVPDSEAPTADPAGQEATGTVQGSLYEQFLHNDIQVAVSSNYPGNDYGSPVVQGGETYTLAELGQRVSAYYLDPEYTDKTSYDSIKYAYVECPDNAAEEQNLLLKFIGLNIYTQDDDSYAVFVITEDDGQLYLTDGYECWARSASIASADGALRTSGSGGAGDHYDGLAVILSDGARTPVYDAEILSGWWTSYVNDAIFSEVVGDDAVLENFVVAIYTIDGTSYYQYDMSGCSEEEKTLCESYIARCRDEQGINWVTDEVIQDAIRNRCAALGVDYGITELQPEVMWNNL